jgi:lantibiotic modifying enzyme
MSTDVPDAETLAAGGLQWLLESARKANDGLEWSGSAGDEVDPSLYSGAAGIVITLLEAHRHFGDDRYADAAIEGSRAMAASEDDVSHCSLYFGLTGMAVALGAVDDVLGDAAAGRAAEHALEVVRSRFDGERWSDQFELLGGNAGIALGALAAGNLDLAESAVVPYLRTSEPTAGGVQWEVRARTEARFHHISHGTLGIVLALAAVGNATGRRDLTELALAGAADVVSRNEGGPSGFLVPHSDPQHRPERIERYSFGWCHGPAGDAQVFRLLRTLTGDVAWQDLADRCWNTVLSSGLPSRLRPGFWDNNGRCCGTAGVLALACDRYAQGDGDLEFASVLVNDLQSHATEDRAGVRWSNYEYRATPSALAPRTGWSMGNAGIVRELLRFARATAGTDSSYAVSWPDHPAVVRIPEP